MRSFLIKNTTKEEREETNNDFGSPMWLLYYGHRYVLDMNTGILKYKNVRFHKDGDSLFPDGYFDERKTVIDRDGLLVIEGLIRDLIPALHVASREDYAMPAGACPQAEMSINYQGADLSFSSIVPIQGGIDVRSIPIPDAFVKLAEELAQYCNFPIFTITPTVIQYPQHITDHLNVRDVFQNSRRVVGYKRSLTGVSEYEFYNEENVRICKLYHHPRPNSFLNIESPDARWESEFEDCTIGPGITRYVRNPDAGEVTAKLVYRERGRYELSDSIDVYCDIDTYSFFAGDVQIAFIEKAKEQDPSVPDRSGDDLEPCYDAYIIRGSMEEELLMLILAFPLLRFL